MSKKEFAHLHCHSQFSVNDGLTTVEDLVDRAKVLGFDYLALTDHGRMGGVPKLAMSAVEPDSEGRTLNPIVGCEVYICDGDMTVKESVDRAINGVVKKRRPKHYHSTMLCINEIGYHNLVSISNIGAKIGYYYEPRVDLDTIENHSEGLIASSGCMSGMLPQYILREEYDKVNELIGFWHDIFKDNFYLEVQYHGIEEQLKIAEYLIEISKKHEIPIIATNDVHYLYPSDKKAHDLLKSMRTNNTENSGKGYATGEFYLKSAEEMYSVWEEYPEFCKNTIAVAEKCQYRFPTKNSWQYPHFDFPRTEKFEDWYSKYMPFHNEHQAFLQYICMRGLSKYGFNKNQEYKDRLKYELTKIFEMSVEEYFLIIWDIFRYCRENNIATGPGRGSGAGSLVLYLLEVSAIDPLDPEMNLIFERFLNPGRSSQYYFDIPEYSIKNWKDTRDGNYEEESLRRMIYSTIDEYDDEDLIMECFSKMIQEILPLENQELDAYYYDCIRTGLKITQNTPNSWVLYYFGVAPKPTGTLKVAKMGSLPDVDSDFDPAHRDDVIAYIKDKYGADNTTNIGTYGQYRARAALRETMKASGYSHEDATEVSKSIPFNHTLKEGVDLAIVQQQLQRYSVTQDVVINALKIEGSAFSHVSEHAAGVVIAPTTLNDKIPMHRAQDSIVSQFDMGDMEKAGYIKFDFLGLSNVGKMARCNEMIEKHTGQRIDFRKIPRDDRKALALFRSGKTETIFQFASEGIRESLKAVGVDNFNDLIAVNALYRPGPMKYISKKMYDRFKTKDDAPWRPGITYAENKQNPETIEYAHPDLEPILKSTYGILCYQESVMAIAQKIGGFTAQEADVLRKAIGKKIGDLFEKCKNQFYTGAMKNGYEESVVKAIWKQAEDFASYSFNKAHAAVYALIGYWNAYLLAYFPYEWMAASIGEDVENEDRYTRYQIEARQMGIKVYKPDVSKSTLKCYVEYDENLGPSIILPLSIIKGVGKNAEDIISQAPFKNFKDFCHRAKPDKRLFEKLLQAGALKGFGSSLELVRLYAEVRDEWREESKNSYIETAQSSDILSMFGGDWGRSVDMKKSEPGT